MNHRNHQAIIILAGLWVLLAAVSARGQTVTTTVPANYTGAVAAAVNMATNKVYVASQAGSNAGAVTVIDGATNTYNTFQDQNANGPHAVAVNSLTNKIYVANQNSNNVTVVDGATDTVASSVNVGNAPFAVAVNPLTNLIYVANNSAGTISVISGSTDTVVATVTVGNNPSAVAVNPVTNKIYVANSTSGTVSVIDGATNTVVASPSDGNAPAPSALAVDPVHNQIYVAGGNPNLMVIDGTTNNTTTMSLGVDGTGVDVAVNPVTNTVYVADSSDVSVFSGAIATTPATLITTLFVGSSPHALAVDPLSNKIYVANFGSANVSVIDGATNTFTTVADTNAVGPYAVTVNPVTNKIYVANNSYTSNVTVIDGADYATTSVNDPSADRAAAVAVNPVTNTAYVANSASDTVTVIAGSAYTASINVGTDPQAILADPLTNMIYVANYVDNDVSVISGATNTVVTTVADPLATNPWAVTGNPVTDTLYVANFGSNNVSVISGATNTVVATMADPSAINPYAVAVNPVTNTIYVANYTSGTLSVFAGDTNTLIATPVVGTNPIALVVNPKTNMIYVANWASNNVSVINGATNTVVATVTDLSASNPTAIDVNTHTNMIYVANNGVSGDFPSAVTVINGADNTFTSIDDPYACGPVALAVNHVSNKIYVANSCASYPYGDGGTATVVTVIDGSTGSIGYAATNNQLIGPAAVAVNPPAGIIYVADSGSVGENNASVIAEQQVNTIPITTTIMPLANNQTSSLTPTFSFTATNTLTTAPIDNLLFQEGTWQAPWLVGTSSGAGSFTGNTSTLAPGFHTLYGYATEGEEATSTNTGFGAGPLTGNITAYSFLVPAPEARLSPGSLTFGSANGAGIPVDTTTPQQTVTLTNTGSVGLTVTAVALSGTNPGDYAESDNCVASSPIAGQGTCTINVTFTPQVVGARLATLVVTDNSGDVPGTQHQLSLTGTASQAASTTTVTSSVGSSVFGESVTFTATVTPSTPSAPTGTITFHDGATAICSTATLTAGQATCTIAALSVATHSITAAYGGDNNFTLSNSSAAPLSFVVGQASSSVVVAASANPSMVGQAVTFTATVTATAPGAGTPTGTVTFKDGSTPICSAVTLSASRAQCSNSSLAVGPHTITATYSGDVNFQSGSYSYSDTVALTLTTTTITASTPNPSVVGQAVSVSFTVAATSPGSGTIPGSDTVTVTDITGASCTATLATGACSLAPKAAGTDTLSATFIGDFNFGTSLSAAVRQTVNLAATTTAITSTAPTSPQVGQALTVSYTVSVNAPGAGTIPGADTVTVTDSTGASCTGTVAAGHCALTPKAVGADTLTATFAGDTNYSSSVGSASASLAIAPNVNLTGLTATTLPDQSTSVGVALGVPASTQLSGTLTLSFASSAAGTAAGYIDPMTCFIDATNQCVTQINFTVAAGATVGILPNNGALQQGTTAGTITVTMTALTAGGASVLPQPAPSLSVVVPPLPPVVKSVSITDVTSTGFNVQMTAYSTPRDLLQATFKFNAASGTDLNGSTPAPVSLSSTAQTYFSSANGAAGGGTFVLTVPFTYSGDTSALGTVTATLTNSVGASSSLTSSAP